MKKINILLIATLLSIGVFAQQHSEEVNIVGAFKPKISKAEKLNFYPKIQNEQIQLPVLRYDFKPFIYESWFDLEPVKPARVGKEQMPLLMRNYIKAGYGNNNTPFLDFYAGSLANKEYAFGLNLKHFSSDGNIDDVAKSAFSSNAVNAFGRYIFKTHQLSARAFYERNVNHRYGFNPLDFPNDTLTDDELKQRFQEFGLNINLKSNYKDDAKLFHVIGLGFSQFTDINDTKELHFDVDLKLDQMIRDTDANRLFLGVEAKLDHYKYEVGNVDESGTYTYLNPYIKAEFNEYYLKVGLNTIFKSDTATTNYLYPNIEAGLEIIPNGLNAVVGIKGEYGRNSFADLAKMNPYINSNIDLKDFNTKFEVYGHLQGKLAEKLDMRLSLSQRTIENFAMFVNDTSIVFNNSFNVLYDEVDVLQASALFSFEAKENTHIHLGLNYFGYDMTNELRAWHRPEFTLNLAGHFALSEKFHLKMQLNTFGKSYARTFNNAQLVVRELDPYMDVNMELEYYHTDHLSFFLKGNNLLNASYEKWHNYPNQKITILGGLSYAF